jgi:serine/threonine protein kinase
LHAHGGVSTTFHLQGLDTLQRLKICHKDLSPENVMILENRSLIIDFGMCLRIPYTDDSRHLLTPRTVCYTATVFNFFLLIFLSHAPIVISALWKTGTFFVIIFVFMLHISIDVYIFQLIFIFQLILTPQPHVSPEIYFSHPFDGHAIEIWAGKVV